MPRSFNGSSQYLGKDTNLGIVGYPFTFGCTFKLASAPTGTKVIMSFSYAGVPVSYQNLIIAGASAGDPIWFNAWYGPGPQGALADGGATSVGVEYRVTCLATSINSRSIWVNQNAKVTDTTNVAFDTNINRFTIGAYRDSGGAALFFDGSVSDAWFIGTLLSDREIAGIQQGISPMMVRQQSTLGDWWHLTSDGQTDEKGARGHVLTAAGSPPVISGYPARYGF